MGLVLAAELVPMLLLLIVGGAIVDRLPRLPVMIASDLVRAGVVGLIAVLVAANDVGLPHLVGLAAIFGVVNALFAPAYSAAIPQLVPPDDRPSANALNALGSRAAGIGGPAIGAVLVATGGTAAAFAVDALSFVVAAALLLPPLLAHRPAAAEKAPTGPPSTDEQRSLVEDVRIGVRTVMSTPWIALTIAVAGITNITLAGPLEAAVPLLVATNLGGDVAVLGLIGSMTAAGSVVGAVIVGTRTRLRHRARLIYGPWILLALAASAMGLPIGVLGVVTAAFVVGLGETTLGLVWTNALQDHVPEDRLGRVYSLDAIGSYALIPLGYLFAGLASDAIGPGPVFVVGGLVSAIILAIVWSLPAVRALD
jgi:MFS family permease